MKELRIAFIEQDAGIGGAEVNLFYLLGGMDRRRFRPLVIVPFEGPLTDRLKELGVQFKVISRAKLISTSTYIWGRKIFNPFAVFFDVLIFLPAIWKIRNFLRREQVDLVHTNSMVAHIYGALAARLAGIPCIWHMQDIVDPKMAFGAVGRTLAFLGGFLPRKIVAVSKAVGEPFDGKSMRKIQVIYNGVDIQKFSPDVDGSDIRKELNITDSEFIVGIVGRLTQWKGQKEFLKAAAKLQGEVPDARFLIVGDTTFSTQDFKSELIQLAKDLKLESKVIFAGGRSDVPSVLRVMDVLVHASILPEPFGLVIIEGMAAGIPVIAANRGGPREIIAEGEDGFLVDPCKTNELAHAIIGLLEDESLRKRISEAGRIKVERHFTVDKFVHQFEQLYLETAH